MIIEGTVYPLGVINKNRWGIPDEEDVVASAIESLKSAKLEICPACTGKSEHHCYIDNTGIELGNILEAYRNGENIDVKVDIVNEHAKEMFSSGEWGTTWSPVAEYETIDANGFVHGLLNTTNLTFVSQPAWNESKNNILYASEDKKLRTYCELGNEGRKTPEPSSSHKISEGESNTLFASSFQSSSSDDNLNDFGEHMPDEIDNTELENIEPPVDEPDYKSLYEAEKVKNEELVAKLEPPVIEPEKPEANNTGIPEDKVDEIVQNAIMAERERGFKERALTDYRNVCKQANIEVKDADITRFGESRFTSEDIVREANIIKMVAEKTGLKFGVTEPNYPKEGKEKKPQTDEGRWTVGRIDPVTKEYTTK